MGKLITRDSNEWPRLAGWLVPGPANRGGNCTELQYRIIERAFRDIGITEVPLGSNRGTRLDAYTKWAGSPLGSWWCAIWVGRVFADAGAKVPQGFPATDEWLEHIVKEPAIGAAIVYGLRRRGPRHPNMDAHHIGIVCRLEPLVLTIEGNRGYAGTTNNGVAVDINPPARRDILGYVHPVPM